MNIYQDAKFHFYDDYIEISERKFQYTEHSLQRHIKAQEFLQRSFDDLTQEEMYEFTGVHVNYFEIEVIDKAIAQAYNVFNQEDYLLVNDLYWWADYDYISEEFYEWVHQCHSDIYNYSKEYIDCDEVHNFFRMLIDVLKYKKDRLDIYDKICKEWCEDGYIYDIVEEEYQENIYCDVIDDDKIYKAICAYDDYIQQNILFKKELKKLKKKEKKRILSIMSCDDRFHKLKSNRIYYEKTPPKKINNTPKQCYIMKDENTGYYKIGNSVNPKRRERTLQAEKPTINLIKVFKENHEKELHDNYSKYRVRGEWFKLSEVQLKYICTHFE